MFENPRRGTNWTHELKWVPGEWAEIVYPRLNWYFERLKQISSYGFTSKLLEIIASRGSGHSCGRPNPVLLVRSFLIRSFHCFPVWVAPVWAANQLAFSFRAATTSHSWVGRFVLCYSSKMLKLGGSELKRGIVWGTRDFNPVIHPGLPLIRQRYASARVMEGD